MSTNDKSVELRDYRGQALILFLMSSRCGACREFAHTKLQVLFVCLFVCFMWRVSHLTRCRNASGVVATDSQALFDVEKISASLRGKFAILSVSVQVRVRDRTRRRPLCTNSSF